MSSPKRPQARSACCRIASTALPSLAPGILIYETAAEGEVFLAVDEGVLVKTGADVLVSVRRALRGKDLAALRDDVAKQFLAEDEEAQRLRSAMAKVESGFLRRFASFEHA